MNLRSTELRSIRHRSGTLAAIAVASVCAAATPASAAPVGGCAGNYELFQIPGDGSRPVAAQADARGNGDGFACQKALHNGSTNVIDNHVQGGGGR